MAGPAITSIVNSPAKISTTIAAFCRWLMQAAIPEAHSFLFVTPDKILPTSTEITRCLEKSTKAMK